MKQKQNQTGRRAAVKPKRPISGVAIRKPARRRSLHVHIALHPMSILLLLCTGVLLVSFTLNAMADSYLVTAIVPAPPLKAPAVIMSPTTGTITGAQAIVVGGTCPADSYVDLFDNGRFAGEAICSSGVFNIGLDLVQGSNELQAQDYNITNAPGPVSSFVAVTYVPGAPNESTSGYSGAPSAVVNLGELIVTQVDTGVPYSPTGTLAVGNRPVFAGVAPPFSQVVVSVQSHQYGCSATANVQGYWNCTSSWMPAGQHSVSISASADGVNLTFPSFNITVKAQLPGPPPLPPLSLISSYSYSVHNVGQAVSYAVSMAGGRTPYALMVSWGDGASDLTVHQSAGTVSISHTYGWINAAQAIETVHVQAIDAAGQSATLQFDTIIRNTAYHSAIANVTKSSGLWGLFHALRPWLWLLWPGYMIVLMLVFSFWLGEHEELARLGTKKRLLLLKRKRLHRRHAHAHRS